MSTSPLAALERCRLEFDAGAADQKLELLKLLARTRLGSARAVKRLHEALCFMRAYPDNAAVLAQVQAMLARFARRADLRAYRTELADSGIAGTPIHYRFFAGQAQWLAQHWPDQLRLDRDDADAQARIARALPPLLTPTEAQALAELKLPGYAALDRLRGRAETDAVFLLRRIAAMPGNGFTREAFADTMDASFVLAPGPDTPSRTAAHFAAAPRVFRCAAPTRARPDLRTEMARAPRSVRLLSMRDGEAIVDLARAAMVTRARSLEAFSFANVRDVWFVDDGDGLAFALIGVLAQRRHAVASYYGGLTLRNGVPIGYTAVRPCRPQRGAVVQHLRDLSRRRSSVHLCALAGRAAARFRHHARAASSPTSSARATTKRSTPAPGGSTPSSASPRAMPPRAGSRAMSRRALQRRPRHRTLPATLAKLAGQHLFFEFDPAQPLPLAPLAELGLRVGAALSARAGVEPRTRRR